MTNDEFHMTKEIPNPNSKATGNRRFVRISGFGLLSDFVIRISSLSRVINENTKHQDPNTKESPNPKLQFGGIAAVFGIWSLEFLWSLVFGIWCLVQRSIGSQKSQI
jgi:hypothetical protein